MLARYHRRRGTLHPSGMSYSNGTRHQRRQDPAVSTDSRRCSTHSGAGPPIQHDAVRIRPHRTAGARQPRRDLLRLRRRFRYLSTTPTSECDARTRTSTVCFSQTGTATPPASSPTTSTPSVMSRHRQRRQLLQLLWHPSPGNTPQPPPARSTNPASSHAHELRPRPTPPMQHHSRQPFL